MARRGAVATADIDASRQPVLVGVYVIGEVGCDQQVSPVVLGQLNCVAEPVECAFGQLKGREAHALQCIGVSMLIARKVDAALFNKQRFRLLSKASRKDGLQPTLRFGAESHSDVWLDRGAIERRSRLRRRGKRAGETQARSRALELLNRWLADNGDLADAPRKASWIRGEGLDIAGTMAAAARAWNAACDANPARPRRGSTLCR